ncbi:hypothetical protein POPTR_012G140600v4 [Populus trichocarpa]|uniref:Longin domain-containing protein n=2 Tax=Populus trichocarpa TaxID=3694 RepID=B9I498_POPTR|nr:25.3 kDa vesicle transport protein isoform X1 [Populus trichocarpa]KAI5569988.1 hypothetical protein BDE02_12G115900 [Populus trichocarpa]PNT11032.1 hypothetical protein POPTR_012G140600v4 [Populus trichocarpa]|eukprot:XP_002318225.1 25.3 kDa vesicle transport protein [Populus trichocarpa]
MVKITIVGRVIDGLPLAQGPRYVNEENDNFLCYKQQGEFILKEISRGALIPSMMTIRIDHHSLNYLIGNGACFMTLCDSSYPRKLAFHYLQDLQKEFERLDNSLVEKITRPYSFVKFDGVIGSIRKQYIDTRTQANLSKLNANRKKDLEIITEHISEILQRKRNSEISERLPATTPRTASPVWGSPLLEVIALKWTPITTIVAVAAILLWASLVLTDNFII